MRSAWKRLRGERRLGTHRVPSSLPGYTRSIGQWRKAVAFERCCVRVRRRIEGLRLKRGCMAMARHLVAATRRQVP